MRHDLLLCIPVRQLCNSPTKESRCQDNYAGLISNRGLQIDTDMATISGRQCPAFKSWIFCRITQVPPWAIILNYRLEPLEELVKMYIPRFHSPESLLITLVCDQESFLISSRYSGMQPGSRCTALSKTCSQHLKQFYSKASHPRVSHKQQANRNTVDLGLVSSPPTDRLWVLCKSLSHWTSVSSPVQ